MNEARARSRASWVGSGEAATEAQWYALRDEVGATEFLGYDTEVAEGVIQAIMRGDERVIEASAGDEVGIVVNQTPFYAESGGQMGDTGAIFSPNGGELAVRDTVKKAGELHLHLGTVRHGTLKGRRRGRIARRERPAAAVARQSLGDASAAPGIAAPARRACDAKRFAGRAGPAALRFQPPEAADPRGHRRRSRARSTPASATTARCSTRLLTPERAVAEGALALFGEKYGEEVRVVAMGAADDPARPYSVELCGGTHVRRTGDIGVFKIVGESAIASGVRRIEALTGAAAEAHVAGEEALLRQAAAALRTSPAELPARLSRLVEENRRIERELAEARRALAMAGLAAAMRQADVEPRRKHATGVGSCRKGEAAARALEIGDVAYEARLVDDVPGRELRGLADDLKRRIGSGVVAIVSRAEGKAAVVVGVTKDLTDRFDAVELVRAGAEALGGKGGGGRADMAQAGGPGADRAEAALEAIEQALRSRAATDAVAEGAAALS